MKWVEVIGMAVGVTSAPSTSNVQHYAQDREVTWFSFRLGSTSNVQVLVSAFGGVEDGQFGDLRSQPQARLRSPIHPFTEPLFEDRVVDLLRVGCLLL